MLKTPIETERWIEFAKRAPGNRAIGKTQGFAERLWEPKVIAERIWEAKQVRAVLNGVAPRGRPNLRFGSVR